MTADQPALAAISGESSTDASGVVEPTITDEKRLHNFTTFFKNYMSVSAVLAAAAPIPVALFDLIPAYDSQKKLTATLSSLAAFLALAYIFFNRATLGRVWFGAYLTHRTSSTRQERIKARQVTLLPLLLIVGSFGALAGYLMLLQGSVDSLGSDSSAILAHAQLSDIPNAPWLLLSQLGFFVFAEAAFIVMALREYTQDLLGITDRKLMLELPGVSLAENAARRVFQGKARPKPTSDPDIVGISDDFVGYYYEVDKRSFEESLARLQGSGS